VGAPSCRNAADAPDAADAPEAGATGGPDHPDRAGHAAYAAIRERGRFGPSPPLLERISASSACPRRGLRSPPVVGGLTHVIGHRHAAAAIRSGSWLSPGWSVPATMFRRRYPLIA